MPVFVYRGKTVRGVIQRGELIARDQQEAIRLMRQRQVAVTSIREKPGRRVAWFPSSWGGRVKGKDLVVFTLQFVAMIKAGIPLARCLEILSNHSENPTLRIVVEDVRLQVEGGRLLAESLRSHPKVFDHSYVSMVEAGEAGGTLDTVLARLAKLLENSLKIKQRVKSALAYPVVVFGIAVAVLLFLLMGIIPLFGSLFSEFGHALPWPTVVVLEVSLFLKGNFLYLLILLVMLGLAVQWARGTRKGREYWDRWLLKIPLVGDLIRKSAVVQLTRTLSSLLSNGVPILQGLSIAAKTSGNVVIEGALNEARISIGEGHTIAEPLAKSGVFPQLVTHMVAVGESAGALDSMLEKIADLYEHEVNEAVASLTTLIEPLIIVVLGVGIGFIVVAMYLPIFTMASVLG